MEKTTVGIIATIVAILVGGIPGLLAIFAGDISSVIGSLHAPHLALASGLGSCCICIPIPLALGVFVLHQRVKASVVDEEPLS